MCLRSLTGQREVIKHLPGKATSTHMAQLEKHLVKSGWEIRAFGVGFFHVSQKSCFAHTLPTTACQLRSPE